MAEKDKKYYWLKLHRDFFKRNEIQIIEGMPGGKDFILFYLKLLCESVDNEGFLKFNNEIPYNEEMLAIVTNTDITVVKSAVSVFTKLHMMEVMDDGAFFMNEVNKMLGSETYWAQKKRLEREKKDVKSVGQCPTNVQQLSNGSPTNVQELSNASPTNVQEMSNNCPTCPSKSLEIEKDIDIEIDYLSKEKLYSNSIQGDGKTDLDKKTYGSKENIFLTDGEYQDLKNDYGDSTDRLIELVSEKIHYRKNKTPIDSFPNYIRATARNQGINTVAMGSLEKAEAVDKKKEFVKNKYLSLAKLGSPPNNSEIEEMLAAGVSEKDIENICEIGNKALAKLREQNFSEWT